jgi:hypothetical protein
VLYLGKIAVANTPAYYGTGTITVAKGFVVQALDWKRLAKDKHSSLQCHYVSNEEKKGL